MRTFTAAFTLLFLLGTSVAGASSTEPSAASTGLGVIVAFVFLAAIVAAAVWFFRGPAKHAEDHLNALAAQISDSQDRALFLQIYHAKGPKSVVAAWLLTAFLSPTISYLYQGRWGLATIAFLTLQGLMFWWLISLFTMPGEVARLNKRYADQAFNELRLARPHGIGSPLSPNVAIAGQ